MIKYELLSVFYNKRKMFVILLFIVIVCFDAYLVYKSSFLYEYSINPYYDLKIVIENTKTACSAAFLSGSSKGHIPQELIIWLLPLYFLFIYSDFHLSELKYNNFQLLEIRASKMKIFNSKMISSFVIGFCVAMIAVFLNFIICLIVFRSGLSQNQSAPDIFWLLSSSNAYLAYIIYMIVFSFISGILCSAMTALSFIIEFKIPLYVLSFGAWYLMIIGKYSITYLTQPFIEYGLSYMIPSFLIFICVVTIPIIIGYMKLRRL